MTEGIKVSLWGKFDEVFPLSHSKEHQWERNCCTGYIYIGRPPLGCRGDLLGWGSWSQLLADAQVPLSSVGHSEPKLALLMCSQFRLQQRLLLTPFHKGQTHGHDKRYGPSCTILEAKIRVRVNLGAIQPCNLDSSPKQFPMV